MNIGRAIYNILKNDTAVSSMVSTRISPNVMAQTSAFPFIVYDVAADIPEGQKDSVALLDTATVMVSAYCKTYKDSNKLSNYIRTALDRVNGMNSGVDIQAINFDGYDDIFDDTSGDDGIYRKSLNFQIRILNSFNNIYSMDFDGVDDYVSLLLYPTILEPATGSISVWAITDTTTSTGTYFKAVSGLTSEYISLFYHAGDNEVRLSYKADGSTVTAVSTDAIEGDTLWHNIVGTWDSGEDEIKLYIDGTLKATTSSLGTFAGSINAAYLGSGDGYFKGNIDEASLWDKALSAAEVTALYNEGYPFSVIADSGLIGWWRMGDDVTSFPTVPDASGNNSYGTATNMVEADIVAEVAD